MSRKKKKKGSSYGGPAGGPHGGWKSKPTKTKSTRASLPPSMGFQPSGGGVDRGLAAAVANQASRDASIAKDRATGKFSGSPASTSPSGIVNISYGEGGVDPKLAAAAGLKQGDPWVSTSGWTVPSGTGTTIGPVGMGDIPPPETPLDDDDEEDKEKKSKEEKESEDNSNDKAEWLTNWWANNKKGVGYRERKNIFTGKLWGSQEAVTAKIAAKLNKGYYKIVEGPEGEPLIIHASTGTPVNPYTGNIVDTQSQGAQGGGYQNEMARITGIDPKNAGVFSTEYQRGNGLSVSEMKPEHALRFLMKKNKGAFEQFFLDSKNKGFNPFSFSAISTFGGALLNKITGSEAVEVGNNLERAGWGKAIKNKDGDYTIKLTETGAKNWAKTFEVPEWVSPESVTKDRDKGWLSDILGTKKFPEAPINLDNLIDQGGYQTEGQIGQTMGFAGSGLIPQRDQVDIEQGFPTSPNLVPIEPKGVNYSWPTDLRQASDIPGTPPSQYPQFTPEGYKVSAYNPSRDYTGGTTDQRQTGDGGGGTTPDPNDPTNPYGNLTFDVYGRPVNYDYTGGPEQIYLGGGWKRDGQYIGSPWGFKKGGIANFKPYGY